MLRRWFNASPLQSSFLSVCCVPLLSGVMLAGSLGTASADNLSVVRDLASRVGPIVGSAQACQAIARPRIQLIVDKFQAVIRESSSNETERADVSRLFDRYMADGRGSVSAG